GARRAALPPSHRTRLSAEALADAAKQRGLRVTSVSSQGDKFAETIDAIKRGKHDGVLMIPDSQIYNAASVQSVLLCGAREKLPVWGFSDKIVKAGALAGIYAAAADVGRDAATIVDEVLKGKS